MIYVRIDWLDLAVQGTLKSLLQHHTSKTSIRLHSAFFIVQLSHPYMTTGKSLFLDAAFFIAQFWEFNIKLKIDCFAFLQRVSALNV